MTPAMHLDRLFNKIKRSMMTAADLITNPSGHLEYANQHLGVELLWYSLQIPNLVPLTERQHTSKRPQFSIGWNSIYNLRTRFLKAFARLKPGNVL